MVQALRWLAVFAVVIFVTPTASADSGRAAHRMGPGKGEEDRKRESRGEWWVRWWAQWQRMQEQRREFDGFRKWVETNSQERVVEDGPPPGQ